MTKLQKYNQIMLALASTGALLFLLFGIGSALIGMFPGKPRDEVLSDEKVAQNVAAGIRTQKAVFEPVIYRDRRTTEWNWSAIIVRVLTLDEVETLPNLSEQKIEFRSVSSVPYAGQDMTNFIVRNKQTSESRLVFKTRMRIDDYRCVGGDDLEYVVFTGRRPNETADNLYLYSVADDRLSQIPLEGFVSPQLQDRTFGEDLAMPLVLLAADSNGNGKYDRRQEVQFPFELDAKTKGLRPLAPMSIYEEAQAILDGRQSGQKGQPGQ